VLAIGRKLGEYRAMAVLEETGIGIQLASKSIGFGAETTANSCQLVRQGVTHDVDGDGTVDLTTTFYACPCDVELANTVAAGPCTGTKNRDLEFGLGIGLGLPALAFVAVVIAKKLRSSDSKTIVY